MTTPAVVLMAVSVISVTALCIWCYWKVLTAPEQPQ